MAIKKLSFKGDSTAVPSRKRKRTTESDPNNSQTTVSKSPAISHSSKGGGNEEEEEGWTDADCLDDLSGPAMLVFESRTTVAADQLGSCFLMPLQVAPAPSTEKEQAMVSVMDRDGDPVVVVMEESGSVEQQEPHDVRQVFIIAKLIGSQTSYSLKNGKSGKYLARSKVGVRCDSDAIGARESWSLIQRPKGWSLQAHDEHFLSVDDNTLIGSEENLPIQLFTIRIQRRNKAKKSKTQGHRVGHIELASKKELEGKVGRKLTIDELDNLRAAQKRGELGEAVLDLRVKGRSDKFG